MSRRPPGPLVAAAMRLAVASVLIAGAGVLAPAPLRAADPAAAAAVAELLRGTLQQGYEKRDAELVLGLYAADAKMRTKLHGEVDRARFREIVERDLKALREVNAAVTLREFTSDGATGTASADFVVTGSLGRGKPVNRRETFYFRMRQEGGEWRVYQQAYRADFGAGVAAPHPAVAPAKPGVAPGGEKP